MDIIKYSIMSLFDLIGFFIISSKLTIDFFHSDRRILFMKNFLLMIILSGVMGILGEFYINKYSIIYGALISIILIYFIYKPSLHKTIFIYVISAIIILIIQFLVLFLFQFLKIENLLDFRVGLVAQFLIIFITCLIYKYIPINLLFSYVDKRNKLFNTLVFNMFFIMVSLLIYRYIELEGLLKDILIVAILSIGMLYINFILLKNALKNEYENKMLLTYKKYLPVIDDLMNKIRAKQHEFDNHIQALNMICVTCEDYESIVNSMKTYMEDLEEDLEIKDLIKLENKILAGFLYEKIKKAKKNSIDFQVAIQDCKFKTRLKDYELIEIIGNLIDNAFETDIHNNVVKISLKKEKDMRVIEVKNKHPYLNASLIEALFATGYSTKSKKDRGYGLSNIKEITQKYNVKINVFNEDIEDENFIVFRLLFI